MYFKQILNISKILPETKETLNKYLTIVVIGGVLSLGLFIGNSYLSAQTVGVSDKKQEVTNLRLQIQQLSTAKNKKEEALLSYGTLTSKVIDKDEFITYLGRVSELYDVSIISLKSGDVRSTNSVQSLNFKFELGGTINNIQSVVQQIDSLGTAYNIKKISIRKEGDQKWLSRAFDSSDSDWLEFDANGMPKQDISLPQALPEMVLNEKGEIIEIRDPRLIGLDDIMGKDKISLYLDVSFLVAK